MGVKRLASNVWELSDPAAEKKTKKHYKLVWIQLGGCEHYLKQ